MGCQSQPALRLPVAQVWTCALWAQRRARSTRHAISHQGGAETLTCQIIVDRHDPNKTTCSAVLALLSFVGRISKVSNGALGSIGGPLRSLALFDVLTARSASRGLRPDRRIKTPATKPTSRASIKPASQMGKQPWIARGTATAATNALSASGSKIDPSTDC